MARLQHNRNSYGHLRVYRGPEAAAGELERPSNSVTVPAGEVMSLLADAVASRRTWLADFEDDEMTLSSDLYEVLLAYQHIRRPVA